VQRASGLREGMKEHHGSVRLRRAEHKSMCTDTQRNDEGLACYRRMPRNTLARWLFKNEHCMRLSRFWALGKAAMARVRDRVSRNVLAGPSWIFRRL
jgi:hypothetical protein